MRKVKLSPNDVALFDHEIDLPEYEFFTKHKETFRRMWEEQGTEFWENFVDCFRAFTVKYGPVKDLPGKMRSYDELFLDCFRFIDKEFVWGRWTSARAVVMDTALITKHRPLLPYLESKSYSRDPFYHRETRETYRRLFGSPEEKGSYVKVYLMFPVYLRFGGSVCICLRRWLDAPPLNDESYCAWSDPLPSLPSDLYRGSLDSPDIDEGLMIYIEEKLHGNPYGPKFLTEWKQGDPRFNDPRNPLYKPTADQRSDWRDDVNLEDFKEFMSYVRNQNKEQNRKKKKRKGKTNGRDEDLELQTTKLAMELAESEADVAILKQVLGASSVTDVPDNDKGKSRKKDSRSSDPKVCSVLSVAHRDGTLNNEQTTKNTQNNSCTNVKLQEIKQGPQMKMKAVSNSASADKDYENPVKNLLQSLEKTGNMIKGLDVELEKCATLKVEINICEKETGAEDSRDCIDCAVQTEKQGINHFSFGPGMTKPATNKTTSAEVIQEEPIKPKPECCPEDASRHGAAVHSNIQERYERIFKQVLAQVDGCAMDQLRKQPAKFSVPQCGHMSEIESFRHSLTTDITLTYGVVRDMRAHKNDMKDMFHKEEKLKKKNLLGNVFASASQVLKKMLLKTNEKVSVFNKIFQIAEKNYRGADALVHGCPKNMSPKSLDKLIRLRKEFLLSRALAEEIIEELVFLKHETMNQTGIEPGMTGKLADPQDLYGDMARELREAHDSVTYKNLKKFEVKATKRNDTDALELDSCKPKKPQDEGLLNQPIPAHPETNGDQKACLKGDDMQRDEVTQESASAGANPGKDSQHTGAAASVTALAKAPLGQGGKQLSDVCDQKTAVEDELATGYEAGRGKLKSCANCGKMESGPKVYKKCKMCKIQKSKNPRFYCGRHCQLEDWTSRHRLEHDEGADLASQLN